MKKRPDSRSGYVLLTVLFLFLLNISGLPGAEPGQDAAEGSPAARKALARRMLPGTQDLQLIIQLTDPSVVELLQSVDGRPSAQRLSATSERSPLDVQSSQARVHRSQLATHQRQFIQSLSGISGIEVQGSLDTVMNAVIARVPAGEYSRIKKLPGVKKIYLSRPRRLLLDAAAAQVNAQGLWNKAGGKAQAGHGIKIGIVDTGIDITNPMFIDASLISPSGFPKGEVAFTNSKVIVARNFIRYFAYRQSVQTSIDEVGHGTFVAGVAAGKEVAAPRATISGMAPGAFLGSYKIFGTPGINDTTTTAAIIAAVDAAVADGMDVLNLSLGGLDYVPPSEDPEISALENAISAGVVIAIAAGNDGPSMFTISSPGSAPDAITVGAVSNSRTFASQIRATTPLPIPSDVANIAYLPGDGPKVTTKIQSTAVDDVQAIGGDVLGCNALPANSLRGKIALILRGTCTYAIKVDNASAAGAVAAIVYNNIPTGGIMPMGYLTSTKIPALGISNADGLALKGFIAAHPGAVQVEVDDYQSQTLKPTKPRVLTDFSAVGPAPDFGIKPDLVAVGDNVYSATESVSPGSDMYDTSKFFLGGGTSFSSPMVAGAAAALRQLFPGLGPLGIKSLLTSTASRDLTVDGINPPSVFHAGNGLLDMGNASSAGAAFSPTNINFGVQSYAGSLSLTQTLSIKNISPLPDQYTLSIEPLVAGPVFSFAPASTGTIAPGNTGSISVSLQVGAPASGGFQGFVVIRGVSSSSVYRVPYWAGLYTPDPSRILTVSQSATGSNSFSSLAAALNAARPGNVIEISDSGTYPANLIIATNGEGLPLHGITIRAAAGQNPVIDGTSLLALDTVPPDITIIGLRDVLLQGLTIKSGQTGVWLLQPSVSYPVSATVDHCTITNIVGSASAGIEVDYGGTLDVTQSVISNSDGVGIFAYDGTYLTVLGTTLQNNANEGIDAYNSNVQILNSTISNNTGPGLYLEGSSGTISGSTFASNRGSYGDGIEIADGNFVVTNNIFESNDRYGIGFFSTTSSDPGPVASFTGNTVRLNKGTGVRANPGQDLRIEGNFIKDNARGISIVGTTSAQMLDNIIVRSTDRSLGNGVDIGGSSRVRLVNNTIYKNTLQGVVATTGTSVSVFNTIVSSNGGGDIQLPNTGDIQFSLIGDRSLTTGNNVTGAPLFANPDADDFSLLPGSPALDKGSNAVTNLPFLDFNRQLRVAAANSGSALPGEGVVDIGALEASSSYPLIFPLLINGAQPDLGDNFTTGIAVLNTGSNTTASGFSAYDSSGGLMPGNANPATRNIGPNAQIAPVAFQLFDFVNTRPSLGAVLASSVQPMAGFFLIFDADFKRVADGVNVSDQTATDLIFPRHQSDISGKASYVLFNPGVNSANITATLFSAAGAQVDMPKTAILAPKGQLIFRFDTFSSSSGYVRVQSDRPISGLEIHGDTEKISALGAVSPGSEARYFFPHIAVNQGFVTSIGIINANSFKTNVLLTAYDNDGRVLGNPKSVALDPNAQLLQSASDLFDLKTGSLLTGYVIAESDQPGIQGFTAFSYDDGIHKSAAAVPADSIPRQHLLFSHVAHQVAAGSGGNYQTGIALLNPFAVTVNYTMRVFDGAGKLMAEMKDALGPRQKVAKILSHPASGAGFFTQALPLAGGHIEVLTDYAVLGFELFFTEDFSQLASVPAQIGK